MRQYKWQYRILGFFFSLFFSMPIFAASNIASSANDRYNLEQVTCDSSGQKCTAVGYYYYSDLYTDDYKLISFTSTDGGSNWTASTPFSPKQNSGYLKGVACSSNGQKCTTVGYNNHTLLSFTSIDGGNHWTSSVSLPPTQGAGGNMLEAVACDSKGKRCVAVGSYSNDNHTQTPLVLISVDGGTTWTAKATLPPTRNVSKQYRSELESVACDSNGQKCIAVGYDYYYQNGNYIYSPLSLITDDGGYNWTASNMPSPAPNVNREHLYSIACDSNGQKCTAVGYYWIHNTSGDFPLMMITTDGGENWVNSTTQLIEQNIYGELKSVSCDSNAENCIAVGESYHKPLSLISSDGGDNWELSTTTPALQSIACGISGKQCTAVGSFVNEDGLQAPLSYKSTDGGISWVISTTLPPVF
jgi:hypothetical protein